MPNLRNVPSVPLSVKRAPGSRARQVARSHTLRARRGILQDTSNASSLRAPSRSIRTLPHTDAEPQKAPAPGPPGAIPDRKAPRRPVHRPPATRAAAATGGTGRSGIQTHQPPQPLALQQLTHRQEVAIPAPVLVHAEQPLPAPGPAGSTPPPRRNSEQTAYRSPHRGRPAGIAGRWEDGWHSA